MYTRKDFEREAFAIVSTPLLKHRKWLYADAVRRFKESNPRFDETKFAAACGIFYPAKL